MSNSGAPSRNASRLAPPAWLLLAAAFAFSAYGAGARPQYPERAALGLYGAHDRGAEERLARSAAPAAIADAAEVLVLTPGGYELVAAGANGFVCIVERSWNGYLDDPEFWNPSIRAPTCYNAAAARSVLPAYLLRTRLVLEGLDREAIEARLEAAVADGTLGPPEAGAMCFMMSRDAHLSDIVGAAEPHMMFFLPRTGAADLGANLPGSPLWADQGKPEPLTILLTPSPHWSDGTPAAPARPDHAEHGS